MRSWSSWRLPPRFTASIMMFSLAMKGSSSSTWLLNDLGMDHQAGGHVQVDVQDGVHRQERLRHRDALVGGIIQRALEPLGGGGDSGVASRRTMT